MGALSRRQPGASVGTCPSCTQPSRRSIATSPIRRRRGRRGTPLPPPCRPRREWPSPPTNLGRHSVGLPLTLAPGRLRRLSRSGLRRADVGPRARRAVGARHQLCQPARVVPLPPRPFAALVLSGIRWSGPERDRRALDIHRRRDPARLRRAASRLRLVPLAPSATFAAAPSWARESRSRAAARGRPACAARPRGGRRGAATTVRSRAADPWRLVLIGRDRGSLAGVHAAARRPVSPTASSMSRARATRR